MTGARALAFLAANWPVILASVVSTLLVILTVLVWAVVHAANVQKKLRQHARRDDAEGERGGVGQSIHDVEISHVTR